MYAHLSVRTSDLCTVVYAHAYHTYRAYNNTSCNFLLDTFLVISLVIVVVCWFIVICIYFHLIFNNHDITFLAMRMVVAFGKTTPSTQVRKIGRYTSKDWDMFLLQMGLLRMQKSEQFSFQ